MLNPNLSGSCGCFGIILISPIISLIFPPAAHLPGKFLSIPASITTASFSERSQPAA